MPPGQVRQHQTVDGGDAGGRGASALLRFAAASAYVVVVVRRQLIRRVQHGVFVVPRQSGSRPSYAKIEYSIGNSEPAAVPQWSVWTGQRDRQGLP